MAGAASVSHLVACIGSFLLRLGRHGSPLKDSFVAQSTPEYPGCINQPGNCTLRLRRMPWIVSIGTRLIWELTVLNRAQSTKSRQLLYGIGCLAVTRFPN